MWIDLAQYSPFTTSGRNYDSGKMRTSEVSLMKANAGSTAGEDQDSSDLPTEDISSSTFSRSSCLALDPMAKVEAACPMEQGVLGITRTTRAPSGSSPSNVASCTTGPRCPRLLNDNF